MSQKCCKCSSSRDLKEISLGAYSLKDVSTHVFEFNTKVHNYIRIDQKVYGVCKQCFQKKQRKYIISILLLLSTLVCIYFLGFRYNLIGPDKTSSFPFGFIIFLAITPGILLFILAFSSELNQEKILKDMALPHYKERLKLNKKLLNIASGTKPSAVITEETKKVMNFDKALILTDAEASEKFKSSSII